MRTVCLLAVIGMSVATPSPLAAQLTGEKQQIRFEHITVQDGLSSPNTTRILQDRRGFMWFGTISGLNRFDGYEFKVYKHDPHDHKSLNNDRVAALYEDRSGLIWIGTIDGLNSLDPVSETFTRYPHDPDGQHGPGRGQVSDFLEDAHGSLWIAVYGGGVSRLDKPGGTFVHYRHDPADPNSLSSDYVGRIYGDRAGCIWISTLAGLDRLDPRTGTITKYANDPNDPNSLSDRLVMAIHEDGAGLFWFGTRGKGLDKLDINSGTFTNYRHDPNDPASLSNDFVLSIHEEQPGWLWIGTGGGGLNLLDMHSGRFTSYVHDQNDPTSLSANLVSDIFEDRSGVLWLSTGAGLDRVNRGAGTAFQIHRIPAAEIETEIKDKSARHVGALQEDANAGIWIGMYNESRGIGEVASASSGLYYLDPHVQRVKHFRHDPANPRSISSNQVWAIHEDREGSIWVGTDGGGLNRFEPATADFVRFRHDPTNPSSLGSDQVYSIYADRYDILWVGTGKGLSRFDPGTRDWSRILHDSPSPGMDNLIMWIHEDQAGNLWIGNFLDGIARLNRATNTLTHYRHEPDNVNSLSHNDVWTIHEDRSGILWIGTSSGLNRFDPQAGQFTRITEQNSTLPSNLVTTILEDDAGYLWIQSGMAISRYDPQTNTFRTYDVPVSHLSLTAAGIKSRSGALYFGGKEGYLMFLPGEVKDNTQPPQVLLTDFKLFNESVRAGGSTVLQAHISDVEEILLAHDQNDLTFEYTGLHYANPAKNQYAYMLEGYEEDWRYVGTQRMAVYPRLPPGAYTFRAKASNSDGIWNSQGASVRVIILDPWWQAWWFRLLVTAMLGSLAYAGYRFRVHSLRSRSRMLELQVAERTAVVEEQNARLREQSLKLMELDLAKSRFFANISHEFRTPLTLILGPIENALGGTYGKLPHRLCDHLERANDSVHRLVRMVNQLLDLSRIESGKLRLDAKTHDIVPILRKLIHSYAPLAERRRLLLRFQPEIESIRVHVDSDGMEKVFANVLSNAVKFTPEGGKVWVVVRISDEGAGAEQSHVDIVVKDTGPGIPSADLERIFDRFEQVDGSASREYEGTGIGLALAKELTELHGGKILVESELGFGAAFTIRLPLHGLYNEGDESERAPYDRDGDSAEVLPTTGLHHWIDAEVRSGGVSNRGDRRGHSSRASGSFGATLLIVEDNEDVRALLRSYLEEDYLLIEAANGEAALEATKRHTPDLVLSDVMMPRMDGHALCRALKSDASTAHIPVILLTARAGESDTVQGLECGADDYVVKPFGMKELRARVAMLIASRRALRAQFSREIVVRPSDVVIRAADEVLLARLLDVLEAHISDRHFSLDATADELGIGRRQLERRIRALTGQTPGEVLRRMRLERAAQLLDGRAGTVAEVANAVGFKSTAYFSTAFRKHFGVSPSERVGRPTKPSAIATCRSVKAS